MASNSFGVNGFLRICAEAGSIPGASKTSPEYPDMNSAPPARTTTSAIAMGRIGRRRAGGGGKPTDAKAFGKHETCGGRTLNDDIVDTILTMWVNKSFDPSKDGPRRLTDNIAIDTPPLPDGKTTGTFPYLGAPHKEFRK